MSQNPAASSALHPLECAALLVACVLQLTASLQLIRSTTAAPAAQASSAGLTEFRAAAPMR